MKTVIQGLEEGLNSIAEALEGGGGGGSVPTPTLDDDGKVLRVVSQSQEEVAPEWSTVREVPIGGQRYQVLTKTGTGNGAYGWANAPTPEPELPSIGSSDSGKVLKAWYDSEEGYGYSAWSAINQVPSGGTTGQVLTKNANGYGWAPASGGGGNIDVIKFDVAQASFTQDGQVYKAHFASDDGNVLTKINNLISITIVDNVDSGYPTLIRPATDECSIWYEDDLVFISISSTVYSALGTRQANHFYMTYYTGA